MPTLSLYDSAFVLGGSAQYAVAFSGGAGEATSAPVTVAGDVTALVPSWWILCPENAALNTPIRVKEFKRSEPITSITAEAPGGAAIASTASLGAHINMQIWILEGPTEKARVLAALQSGLVLRIVSVINESWYVRMVNGVEVAMQVIAPLPSETTALRDAHVVTTAFTEVIYRP